MDKKKLIIGAAVLVGVYLAYRAYKKKQEEESNTIDVDAEVVGDTKPNDIEGLCREAAKQRFADTRPSQEAIESFVTQCIEEKTA